MMKITDLSKCKNFYCPPEVQFIELRIERGFAESSYSATETWPGENLETDDYGEFIICGLVVWGLCSLSSSCTKDSSTEPPLLRENRDTHRNSGKRDYPDLC
mgnify:CR=1 FL=1